MTWDRVIQDSDDEDDPLAADFPPPARPQEPQPARDNENPANQDAVDNESAGASNQIAVNFDEFLQSQEAAQPRLTSSQQRREERWIPANGEGGSIGACRVIFSTALGALMLMIATRIRYYDERDWSRAATPL